MPRVAVLVPSYGHARYLSACLTGLVGQTFGDFEAVVIDDRSPDESLEVARRIAGRDPRIRVHSNPENLGTYATQARALAKTEAPLVAILNSDDVWMPTKLALQVEALDRHPDAPFAFTLGVAIDDDGAPLADDLHGDWPRSERHDLLPFLLAENRVLASSVTYRRESVRFDPSLRYSGDWVALLAAAWQGEAACVAEPLTGWRQHGRNTYRLSPGQAWEEIRVREAILAAERAWSRRLPPRVVRERLGLCAMHLVALWTLFGQGPKARGMAARLIRLRRDRAALRRAMAAWLPADWALARLWPGQGRLAEPSDSPPLLPQLP